MPDAEKDTPWTGCAHCGQTLPHEGTGWREASRCRMFQRIAEQAWDEGRRFGQVHWASNYWPEVSHRPDVNPYRVIPPAKPSGGDS